MSSVFVLEISNVVQHRFDVFLAVLQTSER